VQQLDRRRAYLEEDGLPAELASRVASLPLADRGLNILRIVESTSIAPIDAARVYTRLGEETGLNWMYERLSYAHGGTLWDRMALVDLRQDLLDLQCTATERVLGGKPDDPVAALDAFLADHATDIVRIRSLQQRAAATTTPSALAVIASRLHCLRSESSAPGA
jgi:glutamate dehydrogenase